ncbi:MAG TPA: tetratricopeptide repeat protein [Bacteroidia bacterium]|jgi:hypothetical protein
MAKQKQKQEGKSLAGKTIAPRQKINFAFLFIAVVATLIIYYPSLKNGLTNWDDQEYITNNPHIKGPAGDNLSYHFKNYHMGNYHPLTMISLNLDAKEPLDPAPFHFTNYLLHVFNVGLVFLFVFLLLQNNIAALISALLFGLHPMHVESVAWASERKDVLYAFFFLGALCSYTYSLAHEKEKLKWNVITTLLFILSILSKGQAVVLPVLFILIDRLEGKKTNTSSFISKIHWFALSLIFGVVAIKAQHSINAIQDTGTYPFSDRIVFAGYGIAAYLYKLFVPVDLSCFYPFPQKVNGFYPAIYYFAPAVVSGIALLVWFFGRKNKYLVFACLFFLASISIVLQLLPVGGAVIADRYTYIPYLGFFILLGKICADGFEEIKTGNNTYRTITGTGKFLIPVLVLIFSVLTWQRIAVWKDSITLWNDCIGNGHPSTKAYQNRGKILQDSAQATKDPKLMDLSIADFNEALHLTPTFAEGYYNRGLAYFYKKDYAHAIDDYTQAIQNDPSLAVAWHNRAGTYFTVGKYNEALHDALEAQRLGYAVDPKFIEAIKQAGGK